MCPACSITIKLARKRCKGSYANLYAFFGICLGAPQRGAASATPYFAISLARSCSPSFIFVYFSVHFCYHLTR
nr:hypothetical protein KCFLNJMA_KCFLNJMA_CDS_0009 [Microvirus sp.]